MNLIPKNSPFGALDSFFSDSFPSVRLLPETQMEVRNIAVEIKEMMKAIR